MGIYDSILDEEAKGPNIPPGVSVPQSFLEGLPDPQSPEQRSKRVADVLDAEVDQRREQAREVFRLVSGDNPDQAAEADDLSKTSGLSADIVRRNLDEVRRRERARALDTREILNASPVLLHQLNNPDFTRVAQDDVDTLTAVGRWVKGSGYALTSGATLGVSASLWDLTGWAGDFLAGAAGALGDNPISQRLSAAAEASRETARAGRATMEYYRPEAQSDTERYFMSGWESAGQNLMMLPLGALRAGANAMAAAMATLVGARSYTQAREARLGPLASTVYAVPQAGFEYVFEKIPLERLFHGVANGNGFIKSYLKQLPVELTTEQITTIFQDLNEQISLHPEKTLRDYINERPEAAYATLIATVVGTAVQTGAVHGLAKVADLASGQKHDQDAARIYADNLQQLFGEAAASKLRGRAPSTFQDLVQTMSDAEGGEQPTSIYVDAAVLAQAAQTLPEGRLDELLPSVREQLESATETGAVVEIPIGEALTNVPGSEIEETLLRNARSAPEALSLEDAEQAAVRAEQFIADEAANVLASAADTDAWQTEVDAVNTAVFDQLQEVGKWSEEANRSYATLQSSFFSAMAGRFGTTPLELYNRYALRVQNAGAPARPAVVAEEQIGAEFERRANQDPALVDEYIARFGNIVNPDNAKELSDVYNSDPGKYAAVVHEGSSTIAKKVFAKLLAEQPGARVLFSAGGGGSGKTYALENLNLTDPTDIVYDSTMSSFPSAKTKIDQALAAGHPVTIAYTNTEANRAFQFALKRGRVVPISALAGAHAGAAETIRQIAEHYADNPDVEIRVINNTPEGIFPGVLDDVPSYSYTELERGFHEAADRAFAEGRITGKTRSDLGRPVGADETDRAAGMGQPGRGENAGPVREVPGGEGGAARDGNAAVPGTVLLEVAPDPNDTALTEEWNGMSDKDKADISRIVASKIIPQVLKAFGTTGNVHMQIGGYLGATNPSLALDVADPAKVVGIAKALGHVLSQDGMMVVSNVNAPGLGRNGGIHITLPEGAAIDDVSALYAKLWEIEVGGKRVVTGHTTTGGVMAVINDEADTGVSTADLAALIDNKLDGEYTIRYDDIFTAYISKEDYGYVGGEGSGAGTAVGDVDLLRKEATDLLRGELAARRGSRGQYAQRVQLGGGATIRASALGSGGQTYGERREGAASVLGVHYSREQRGELTGDRYGAGLAGDEAKRLSTTEDDRLKSRVYFYVDTGNGITPDVGVGTQVHSVQINNLYDTFTDPEGIVAAHAGDNNAIESAVLDAGYIGVFAANGQTGQGVAVLLGNHTVPVAYQGEHTPGFSVQPDGRLRYTLGLNDNQPYMRAGASLTRAAPSLREEGRGVITFAPEDAAAVAKVLPGVPPSAAQQGSYAQSVLPPTIDVDGVARPTTNSNGSPIAQTEEGLRNFWRWFGDSKVVDDQGRPRLVYHGTPSTVSSDFAFDPSRSGVTSFIGIPVDVHREGFYFAEKKGFAEGFAAQSRGKGAGAVLPVYLSLNNYLDVTSTDNETVARLREVAERMHEKDPAFDVDYIADLAGYDSFWEMLDTEAGGAEFVSAARELGYDGVRMIEPDFETSDPNYTPDTDGAVTLVAFNPNQIKSADNNGGFDPADDRIFHQAREARRGEYDPNALMISLGKAADMSTFLHESAHYFLDVMVDLASRADAPADVRADMDAVMAWFGIEGGRDAWATMSIDQRREYHERWAESFEQYLLEGKAPSAELRGAFRAFREFLTRVYSSLKAFMEGRGLELSDDIRQVFDRMLASEEQIKAAEEAAGMAPDIDATAEAIEKLQARSLRDLKWLTGARNKLIKKMQRASAAMRKQISIEERERLEGNDPAYRAIRLLRTGSVYTDDMTPEERAAQREEKKQPIKISADSVKALGYELADFPRMTSKDGVDPDVVADLLDDPRLPDGNAVLAAIKNAEPLDALVEANTDRRMLEEHADLSSPRAIEDAANEAIHNDARARALATELTGQDNAMKARTPTGRTDVKGRPITANAMLEAANRFAEDLSARALIKTLKMAVYKHRMAEAKAGREWKAATKKGDTQAAIQAKRRQLLNNRTVKYLTDAQADVREALDFFRRVVKGNNEKMVKGGRDPDVVNAMRAVLGMYGIAPRAAKTAAEYMELVKTNDPSTFAALAPSIDAALNGAKPWGEMPVSEMRALHEELKAMWLLAKRSRQMEVEGKVVELDDAAAAIMERLEEIGIPETVPGETQDISRGEELGLKLAFAKAILTRVEQWAEGMDGEFGGPFLRLIFGPIKAAADNFRASRNDYRTRYAELVKAVGPHLTPGQIAAPELGYTFGAGKDSGSAVLLHAILHTGNESNKRKLLLGRGWASENEDGTLDTTRWDAFLRRMIDQGVITKAHYDYAQGVWDLLESMKPAAQEAHRKVYGRYFAEVTAEPVVTPWGVYRGGYVPAQTDARIVTEAKLRELAEAENASMAYAFPSAPSGFTKARVEYNKPLLLDLRVLAQHIDKVLLFTHMQPAVNDVRRLLTRKDVGRALDRVAPGAYEAMLTPWLQRSAQQIVETPIAGDRKLSRFLSAARSRTGMAFMFANISNTVQQLTGFSSAAVKVRPRLMVSAAASYMAHPGAMTERVCGASTFMRDRMKNEVAAMNDAIEDIIVNPGVYDNATRWTRRHAYFAQSAFDNVMSPIIWTAAYNDATEQGHDHAAAVRFADGVIRQTQGSTLPEDISRFETGSPIARIFTQFIGYFNMMANTNATAFKQAVSDTSLAKGAGRALYVALTGMLIPIWVAEAIAIAFRGGPDDPDNDGYLDDWLMAVFGLGTLRGAVAMIPIVGPAVQVAAGQFTSTPADDKFSMSPAVSLIESALRAPKSIYDTIVKEGKAQKAVRDVAAAVTLITGLPIYAAARPVGYAAGVAEDKIRPTNVVDMARGLVTGSASPESRVTSR